MIIYLTQYHGERMKYFALNFIDLLHLLLFFLVRLMLKSTIILFYFIYFFNVTGWTKYFWNV